jgi:hypothetical protein
MAIGGVITLLPVVVATLSIITAGLSVYIHIRIRTRLCAMTNGVVSGSVF